MQERLPKKKKKTDGQWKYFLFEWAKIRKKSNFLKDIKLTSFKKKLTHGSWKGLAQSEEFFLKTLILAVLWNYFWFRNDCKLFFCKCYFIIWYNKIFFCIMCLTTYTIVSFSKKRLKKRLKKKCYILYASCVKYT